MLKYLLAFLLIMHGLAHVTGLLGFWASGPQAFADKAWIFTPGVTVHSAVGRAYGFLWLAAALGLAGAGLGLLLGQAWWPPQAMAGAAVSLLSIVPWLDVVPPGAWAGGLLDLVILGAMVSPWATRIVAALH